MDGKGRAIVLFDGVCNLCSASVQFIVARDVRGHFRFASLQSSFAQTLLEQLAPTLPRHALESVLLAEGEHIFARSEAALRIAAKLSFPWPIFAVFWVVPRFIRDAVYDWIARNRYRWFGKKDACWMPTPELRARFLDTPERAGAQGARSGGEAA